MTSNVMLKETIKYQSMPIADSLSLTENQHRISISNCLSSVFIGLKCYKSNYLFLNLIPDEPVQKHLLLAPW